MGLTLIYGVMKILNVAHGSLYALGAYAAAILAGYWLAKVIRRWAATARCCGRHRRRSDRRAIDRARTVAFHVRASEEIVLVLVTYALFLILEDVSKLVFGVIRYASSEPYGLLGNLELGHLIYPVYSLVLVLVSVLVGVALAYVMSRTRHGKMLLAVIHDREMSMALGINVSRVYLVTFTVGVMLAALGGALTAPTTSVQPGISAEVIVLAFAVVVIGGLGSPGGAALGALIVGLVRSAAVHYRPELELFSVYLVMAVVLIIRPKGLFAVPEPRKI